MPLLTHWFPAQQGLKPDAGGVLDGSELSYSLISSTTRIETYLVLLRREEKLNLLTDFQHNKDWNKWNLLPTYAAIPLTHWFPAQQGLKPLPCRAVWAPSASYSLISSTTRIETSNCNSVASVVRRLLTDFQHNKDWNTLKNRVPCLAFVTYSLISSTTRIETHSLGVQDNSVWLLLTDFQHNKDWNDIAGQHYTETEILTHWFPAQQGLKRHCINQRHSCQRLTHWFPAQQGLKHCRPELGIITLSTYSLISSTTRIETLIAASQTYQILPYSLISSTTRIETNPLPANSRERWILLTDFQHNKDWNKKKNPKPCRRALLTHWFPAQQGLKQGYFSVYRRGGLAYSLISSTTRIETPASPPSYTAPASLLTDFQHNKDWNNPCWIMPEAIW